MKSEKISELTTSRLSVYLRCLNALNSAGIKTISSQALAEQFNLNSAQIERTWAISASLVCVGLVTTSTTCASTSRRYGLDTPHRVGIVGAGRLGTALANYNGFGRSNFTVVALFDNDRQKIGHRIGDAKLPVHDADELSNIIREQSIDVMVIAVPAKAAQRVLNQITSAGIKAVLNFAPASLISRRGVKVKTVDLTTSLESLSYFLSQPSGAAITQPRSRTRDEESLTHRRKGAKATFHG